MSGSFKHPIYVQMLPGYEHSLGRIVEQLSHYRIVDGIDYRSRTEAWLSNFSGIRDQRLALDMLGRVRVVSEPEIVAACRGLHEKIGAALPGSRRMFHFAHETSGGLLVRILEKDLRVRSYAVLRHSDFAKLGALGKVRDGDAVVVWDRFNGTGRQLSTLVKRYTTAFAKAGKKIGSLQFAYIAGHPLRKELSGGALLHRWIEDLPLAPPEEADLCDRYAAVAGATKKNRKHETGALLTFADNPPNNVPLVLRAPGSETWFTLLDRKETAKP